MQNSCGNCSNVMTSVAFEPVTHVIFDLDGVIIDSENIYKDAFKKTVEDYGHAYNEDLYKQVAGLSSPNAARILKEEFNLDAEIQDIVKKYRGYSKDGICDLELIPGVERLIRHLHDEGVPLAIATSSAKQSVDLKMIKFKDLIALFSHMVCGGDPEAKNGKPHPDVYLVCASRFPDKPPPSKCLVFEDSHIGMRAGLAAGMQVVMIPNDTVHEEVWKMATMKISSFYDFKPELFGLPPFRKDHVSSTDVI